MAASDAIADLIAQSQAVASRNRSSKDCRRRADRSRRAGCPTPTFVLRGVRTTTSARLPAITLTPRRLPDSGARRGGGAGAAADVAVRRRKAGAGVGRGEAAGFGVRVIHSGVWGFASSPIVTEDEIRRITLMATEVAKASQSPKRSTSGLRRCPRTRSTGRRR